MRREVSGLTRDRVAGFRARLAVPGCTPAASATSTSFTRCTPVTVGLLGRFACNRLSFSLPDARSGSGGRSVSHLRDLLTVSPVWVEGNAIVRMIARSTEHLILRNLSPLDGGSAMHQSNRLWRKGGVPLVVAALALTLGACASSSNNAGAAASPSAGKPLVVGASVSLTGDFADAGKAVKRGYELWANQVNAKGGVLGRKVTMKIVDDTSSPTQVVSNYQNLINRDKVDLVVGPFSSLLTVPASQVAKRYGYSFLEPAGGGPKVFAQKLDNLFFVQPAPTTKSGDVFADWILSLPADKRPKTAAYTELDDPFAQPIAENIRARFDTAGIMSAGDWFPGSTAAGSADFEAAYIKANGGTADTIDNSSAEAFACG